MHVKLAMWKACKQYLQGMWKFIHCAHSFSTIHLFLEFLKLKKLKTWIQARILKARWRWATEDEPARISHEDLLQRPKETINNWFIRQRAVLEIWSTLEVSRAWNMRKSCSRRNREQVLSKLPKCFISRWRHSWCMNQWFYNIFNPMENFFSRGICLLTSWACTIGIWSTLA